MTDYLEEALEGLDALARRLRRLGTPTAGKEENVEYFHDKARKMRSSNEKSQNVSKISETVDEEEIGINRLINQVYDLSGGRKPSPWGAADVDSGGSGVILRSAELAEDPTGRDEGRDSGPVPLRGPETGWLPGGVSEGWPPAGEAGASGPPASEETRWAEQADRVFRRDSRRYDGGFYLY